MKAYVECIRGNHDKSIKLLNSSPKNISYMETGQPIVPMFYNNMAYIHFHLKKYNLAVLYAKKAFEENATIMKTLPSMEKCKTVSTLGDVWLKS